MASRPTPTLLFDEAALGAAAQAMVDHQLRRRGIGHDAVLQQMRTVPRHVFVDPALRHRAYQDCALPTLNQQTISQPYIVALMSELLDPQPADRLLEVGTGSGYQTAILARLCAHVDTIERDGALADAARRTLGRLGIDNVTVHIADGTLGLPDRAPFDGILVTAAAPAAPQALVDQLADARRLVIPLGDRQQQMLTTVTRRGEKLDRRAAIACRFVPLVGEQGW